MKKLFIIICLFSITTTIGLAQQITFTPQWTPQSQFAGYYAAYENGYYEDAGLDVRITHPSKSYSNMSMLEDGKSDIITCELIQALMYASQGDYLVNLLQTTQHSTLVLITRSKDVNSMSDLAGNRIGTWKVGFNEIPHMIDKTENLGIEWIKQINAVNLYISGAIDATLAKSYNEQILFSMSGITPGTVYRFADNGFDYPEDGVFVTEEFYRENQEQCRLFAEASRKGWEWVRNNREAALDIVMKYVKAENISTNRYHQKWMLETILEAQEDTKGSAPTYNLNRDDFDRLNEILLKYNYIKEPIDYNRITGE